jgi:hypothetical protein
MGRGGSVDESGALWVEVEEYPEVDIVDGELESLLPSANPHG